VHKLGALVEECGVVFVCLNDEEFLPIPSRTSKIPKFPGTPPIRNPGAMPACSRIQAIMLEVVVLP
jgi:hypothetical protein